MASLDGQVDQMVTDPADYFHRSATQIHSISRDKQDAMQLLGYGAASSSFATACPS